MTTGIRIVKKNKQVFAMNISMQSCQKNWVKATMQRELSLSVVTTITSQDNTERFTARYGRICCYPVRTHRAVKYRDTLHVTALLIVLLIHTIRLITKPKSRQRSTHMRHSARNVSLSLLHPTAPAAQTHTHNAHPPAPQPLK